MALQVGMTNAASMEKLKLFIMYDMINLLTGLTSSEFRAAASRHNLQEEEAVISKISDLMDQSK